MTLELINTYASIATLVVIAITAVAAMIQLRHIRHGNQLESIMALRELRSSKTLDEAHMFVVNDLNRAMEPAVPRRPGEPAIAEPVRA